MVKKVIKYTRDSPDVGIGCICSLCGEDILQGPPIRMWLSEIFEARFHVECGVKVVNNPEDYEHKMPWQK